MTDQRLRAQTRNDIDDLATQVANGQLGRSTAHGLLPLAEVTLRQFDDLVARKVAGSADHAACEPAFARATTHAKPTQSGRYVVAQGNLRRVRRT